MQDRIKRAVSLTLSLLLCVGLYACAAQDPGTSNGASGGKNPIVTIEMENGGIIKAELYPNIAPNTVANFVTLAQSGFYDGVIFHRVIQDFVIQGGDPDGNGTGGPGYYIKGEFSDNGVKNDLKHERGVLSMARSNNNDSAGSQFFVCVSDSDNVKNLDNKYAGFGKVMDEESMKVVDEIVTSATPNSERTRGVPLSEIKDENGERIEITQLNMDMPIKPQVIKTVTVDTFGTEYTVTKINK